KHLGALDHDCFFGDSIFDSSTHKEIASDIPPLRSIELPERLGELRLSPDVLAFSKKLRWVQPSNGATHSLDKCLWRCQKALRVT
ncbi:MAG: hypothetical protein ACK44Q_03315, partial [Pirellulaceae bacterium]